MENAEKALDGLCQDICEDSLEDCSKVCAAKAAYENIMEISDYTKFCKVLNPDKIDGWDNSLAMAENFPNHRPSLSNKTHSAHALSLPID